MSTTLENIVKAAMPASRRAEALAYVRGAIGAYRQDKRGSRRPSVSAQRVELKKAIGYATKLRACLEGLTPEVAIYLPERMGDTDVVQYRAMLERLKERVGHAHAATAEANRTRSKDPALYELLGSLRLVWSKAHPKQLGVTWNGADDKYHGPFLDFAHGVLQAEGITYTYPALGKRLYNLGFLPWKL